MTSEKELVLCHFNVEEIDSLGIQARIGKSWYYITDLTLKYRKEIKTKQKQKLRAQKIHQEFNLVKENLISEVEDYCNDLFCKFDDIVVFINRTSVNVFDPITQTTAYCMLHPVSHCVNLRSTKFDIESLKNFSKSIGYSVAKKEDQCLVNHIHDTKDVAHAIYDILTKLRYE